MRTLGVEGCFDVICLVETEEYGKLHPAVYIRTAQGLYIRLEHRFVSFAVATCAWRAYQLQYYFRKPIWEFLYHCCYPQVR